MPSIVKFDNNWQEYRSRKGIYYQRRPWLAAKAY
jgi:hypothetical protein